MGSIWSLPVGRWVEGRESMLEQFSIGNSPVKVMYRSVVKTFLFVVREDG